MSLSKRNQTPFKKTAILTFNAVNQSVTSTELESVMVGKLKPQTEKVLVRFISFSTNVCFNHSHTKYVKIEPGFKNTGPAGHEA